MKSAYLTGILRDADALLVVPPFAAIEYPSLGLHVIQACAREAGFDVLILYSNILFAQQIGEKKYKTLSHTPRWELIGERIFANCAFGCRSSIIQKHHAHLTFLPKCNIDEMIEMITPLQAAASEWTDKIAKAILRFNIPVIGCNNSFEQISSSVALLNRIKACRQDVITIVGGANCEEVMAEGILSLTQCIDYIFSGESEQTFPGFLNNMRSGMLPADPVIAGSPCVNLDDLPETDFSEYYDQMENFLPGSQLKSDDGIWLPYETSRGCWWGEKHHCKFCGISGKEIKFRKKSSAKVIEELTALTKKHSANKVWMADSIMPYDYFKTLIPVLGMMLPDLDIFYETRPNLTFEQVVALKEAGVRTIQPGIEAFSTELLKLMNKGVTAVQNIALLRFARSVGLSVVWNLLYCIPGDSDYHYESTLHLLPLLHHLPPPLFAPIIINRFSPYFNQPHMYGIDKLRAMEMYGTVFPRHANLEKLAYYFEGDYHSATRSKPHLLKSMEEKAEQWRAHWEDTEVPPPKLVLTRLLKDTYMLVDTRGLPGTKQVQFISYKKALAALFGSRNEKTDETDWALENFLCVELDSQYVPLATASYEVYAELKKSRK